MTSTKAVFGYGSLVNGRTHDYAVSHPATLTGWRRVWKQAASRPVAFLSIEPHDTTLHGRLAVVPDHDWSTLDAREHAYLRRDVNHQLAHDATGLDAVAYEANPEHTAPPSTGHPILLSYLDVVLQGYLDLLGPDGPAHFTATTAGWGPVLDDRRQPLYPRSQPLARATRAAVDAMLQNLSVPVQPAESAGLLVETLRRAQTATLPHDAHRHDNGDKPE